MQNYLPPLSLFLTPELSSKGVIAHIYEEGTKMPHVDAIDVGKFAAAALLEPEKFRGEEIELGSENLTVDEVVGKMKAIGGVEVGVRKRSEEETKRVWDSNPTQRFQRLANEKDLSINGSALAEKYGIQLTSLDGFLV
jgi:hypothetical protein